MTYQPIHAYLLLIVRGLICSGLFLFFPLATSSMPQAVAAVVINEIFPKPVPDETAEWIELYNTGPDQVSLGNWRLENIKEPKGTFIMSASVQIPVGGIVALYQSQTGIKLNDEGDEVKLFNPENNQMDSQSYPSTLGFNNSVGRSTDGSGSWTVCEKYTPNHLNDNFCPAPTSAPTPTSTPTPTRSPTQIPSPTPMPTLLPTLTPTSPPEPTRLVTQPQVLAAIMDLTTTPVDKIPDNSRLLGVVALLTGIGLGFVALIGWLVNRHRHQAS